MQRLIEELKHIVLSGDRSPKAFDVINDIQKRYEQLVRDNEALKSKILDIQNDMRKQIKL